MMDEVAFTTIENKNVEGCRRGRKRKANTDKIRKRQPKPPPGVEVSFTTYFSLAQKLKLNPSFIFSYVTVDNRQCLYVSQCDCQYKYKTSFGNSRPIVASS